MKDLSFAFFIFLDKVLLGCIPALDAGGEGSNPSIQSSNFIKGLEPLISNIRYKLLFGRIEMPYKNSEKQKKCQHEYYLKNKEKYKENTRRRRKEYKEWFLNVRRSLKCERCEEDHPGVLDFHHRDPEEKENTVSVLSTQLYPKEKILAEIEKCEVLCANCHRKLHWDQHKNGK